MNKVIIVTLALLTWAVMAHRVQATHGGLHGIRDSTGVTNDGSGVLSWQDSGHWSHCNAASQSCGSTTGYQTTIVNCRANWLNGTASTVEEHLCLNVVATIGPKPATTRACTRNWGACAPFSLDLDLSNIPGVSGGKPIGSCGASVDICQAYEDTFGRAPEPGPGPIYWQDYVDDTGHIPGSKQFQEDFVNGARNDDCGEVPGNGSSFC